MKYKMKQRLELIGKLADMTAEAAVLSAEDRNPHARKLMLEQIKHINQVRLRLDLERAAVSCSDRGPCPKKEREDNE